MGGDGVDNASSIRMEREFEAPVERVYRAWCAPADLEQWAWGSIGQDVAATVDLRPGGGFRISTARPDGTEWAFSGSYIEVVPNRRLVHTLEWEAPMGYEAEEQVTVEFNDQGGKTAVMFIHDGVPDDRSREGHIEGWGDTFDMLGRLLEGGPGGEV